MLAQVHNAVTTIANLTTLKMLIDDNPFTVFPRVRSGSEGFANRVLCISPLSFSGGRCEPLEIKRLTKPHPAYSEELVTLPKCMSSANRALFCKLNGMNKLRNHMVARRCFRSHLLPKYGLQPRRGD